MGGGEATRAIALSMGILAFRKAAAPQVPIAARGAFGAVVAGQVGSERRAEKAGTFPSFQFGAVQR
jgi:hypothetical protein